MWVRQVAGSLDSFGSMNRSAAPLAEAPPASPGQAGSPPAARMAHGLPHGLPPSLPTGRLRQGLALGAVDLAALLLRASAVLLLLSPLLLGALLLR